AVACPKNRRVARSRHGGSCDPHRRLVEQFPESRLHACLCWPRSRTEAGSGARLPRACRNSRRLSPARTHMNYRHAFHAGNFADVMKHAGLALVLEHLKQKEKPFYVLDTHAGTGTTDLSGPEAQKTGEFRDGIARILAEEDKH